MKAKKSYGQHFLADERIAQRIAESALEWGTGYKDLVEVGPGMGALSRHLLAIGKANDQLKITAVEADKDMVDYLAVHYPKLNVFQSDFLQFNPAMANLTEQFGVIGNFPYNISSQICFWIVDRYQQVPEMTGMFQKEVAERICAGPGSKEYGIISVLIQAFYETKYLFTVKPGSFNPPPKVMSGVIRLQRKTEVPSPALASKLKTLVKTAFGQRRKMLRNTLSQLLPTEVIENDPFFTKRPEQLSLQEFLTLAEKMI